MSLCKRLIARLDVKGTRLIKGIRFEGLKVMGDSCEAAINYYQKGVDEILYIDSVASLYGRNSLTEILKTTSKRIFIPITAGGGIRCVKDAAKLLSAGADKVAVNTSCIENPHLITDLVNEFGSQCVVVSIQARNIQSIQKWECMTEAGRERSNVFVIDWIKKVQDLGAGEILLTSVDQDGTCKGPDMSLIEKACEVVKIPLIVGGGFAGIDQIENCFRKKIITGVSIAAALHHQKVEVMKVKNNLLNSNLNIRIPAKISEKKSLNNFGDIKVGIIDYGMGNQQSLINAFTEIGIETILTSSKEKLLNTDVLALPGVGSFPNGMKKLNQLELVEFIKERVKKTSNYRNLFGNADAFEEGSEFKNTKGLSLIEGTVDKLILGKESSDINVLHM